MYPRKGGIREWFRGKRAQNKKLVESLKRYGVAGMLSYGLLNTVYYLVTFLFVWGEGNLPLQVLRSSDPVTGPLIGSVSLAPPEYSESLNELRKDIPRVEQESENQCELGYYLHPDWRGMGIMSAGVQALVQWARKEHGVSPFVRVVEHNASSRKVIDGIKQFVRDEERDGFMDWPEKKGALFGVGFIVVICIVLAVSVFLVITTLWA
ncbi:hypothetical protein R1sor_022163 [Riccia sorocarpa]|uniref:N-acetyltransferase domain-containing protein n=1 Tax=Riccia sorocarpa TaxID=122646 RepID=A0ABD3GM23_9MARC